MDPKHRLFEEKRLCALSEKIIEMHVFQGEEYVDYNFTSRVFS